jgi:uridylate kinase|tara:strand:+ start:316 stop:1059 length:744 start_codon:yes stop_codon:yes gene_type:complete
MKTADTDISQKDNFFSRVMIKLSGEALLGSKEFGIDSDVVDKIALDVVNVAKNNIEVCIVVGGGNIFRGVAGASQGIERGTADSMGMLATVINALAIQNSIEKHNIPSRVLSAVPMQTVCEPFIRRKAIRHLEKGRIVIFAGGTGNPYFTTDTAAALRAAEMNCTVLMKGTKVDGVYTSDPVKDKNAERYENITYSRVLSDNLGIMDASAISLARDNSIPIIVFSIHAKNALVSIINGESKKTIISN